MAKRTNWQSEESCGDVLTVYCAFTRVLCAGLLLTLYTLGCRTSSVAPAPKRTLNVEPSEGALPAVLPELSGSVVSLMVGECQSCLFKASDKLHFRLDFSLSQKGVAGEGLVVNRIGANGLEDTAKGASGQTLQVPFVADVDKLLLEAIDLDFDGVLDLVVGAVLGTPNHEATAWRVNSQNGRLERLGAFFNLRVDKGKREIVSSKKGGHGGRLYSEKTYRWLDGSLALVRSVEQALEGDDYIRTSREYEGRKIVNTRREVGVHQAPP